MFSNYHYFLFLIHILHNLLLWRLYHTEVQKFHNQSSIIVSELMNNPHRNMDMVLKLTFTWWLWWLRLSVAEPQINLLNSGCSQYNVSDVSNFYTNLNATFSDLRTQLNNNKYFATAQQVKGSEPVCAMAQCRKYLSNADCVACFTPLGRKFATALLPMVPCHLWWPFP